MNINDFNIKIPEGDKLEIIFNHQIELMEKYHPIEEKNVGRILPRAPINLDDPAGQQRLKDFAWRITEELAEATECLRIGNTDEVHYLEELIDALHFSIEFDVMSGLISSDLVAGCHETRDDKLLTLFDNCYGIQEYKQVREGQRALKYSAWRVVECLGVSMNCLKNKPWKTTHMATDKDNYKACVLSFNHSLINLLSRSGFNAITLTQCYLNKNAVNQFRIRSNY